MDLNTISAIDCINGLLDFLNSVDPAQRLIEVRKLRKRAESDQTFVAVWNALDMDGDIYESGWCEASASIGGEEIILRNGQSTREIGRARFQLNYYQEFFHNQRGLLPLNPNLKICGVGLVQE